MVLKDVLDMFTSLQNIKRTILYKKYEHIEILNTSTHFESNIFCHNCTRSNYHHESDDNFFKSFSEMLHLINNLRCLITLDKQKRSKT